MPLQSFLDVVRKSHVPPIWIRLASKDVDEPFARSMHAGSRGTDEARPRTITRSRKIVDDVGEYADFSNKSSSRLGRFLWESVRLRPLRGLRRDSLRLEGPGSLSARLAEPKLALRSKASEGWLGGRDSNPDNGVQSAVSYR